MTDRTDTKSKAVIDEFFGTSGNDKSGATHLSEQVVRMMQEGVLFLKSKIEMEI